MKNDLHLSLKYRYIRIIYFWVEFCRWRSKYRLQLRSLPNTTTDTMSSPAKFTEVMVISSAASSQPQEPVLRDTIISIVGATSSTELSVNKALLSSKSPLLADLFASSLSEPVLLEENNSTQLALFLDGIHSPKLATSLQLLNSWNSSHAKLACKYLLLDYVGRYAELAKMELERLCPSSAGPPLPVEIDVSGTIYSTDITGRYELVGSDWVAKHASSDGNTIRISKTASSWSITDSGYNFTLIGKHDVLPRGQSSWQMSHNYGNHTFTISDAVPNPSPPKCRPFAAATESPERVQFWDVVDAVLTHDGLKLTSAPERPLQLRDTADLSELLMSGHPFHLWGVTAMLRHFTIEEYSQLCLQAGAVVSFSV